MKPWEMDWGGAEPGPATAPWQMQWGEAPDARVRRIASEVGRDDPAFVDFATRVAALESGGGRNTTGPQVQTGMHRGDRARGAWQIMPKTFTGMGGKNIDDPDEADRLGAKYLHDNWQRFGRDERKAAQAHFAGLGSVRADGTIPTGGDGRTSIRSYVDRVAPSSNTAPPWTLNWTK